MLQSDHSIGGHSSRCLLHNEVWARLMRKRINDADESSDYSFSSTDSGNKSFMGYELMPIVGQYIPFP